MVAAVQDAGEELDDWLTFPVLSVAVGLGAAAPSVSCVCAECGEPPDEHPHSRPMETVHRVERRRPAGSPKKSRSRMSPNEKAAEAQPPEAGRHGGQTCPSRPILIGLCSFHGLERWAVLMKGSSLLWATEASSAVVSASSHSG